MPRFLYYVCIMRNPTGTPVTELGFIHEDVSHGPSFRGAVLNLAWRYFLEAASDLAELVNPLVVTI